MKPNKSKSLVHLGRASRETLGADGRMTDFVRMLDHSGIAND